MTRFNEIYSRWLPGLAPLAAALATFLVFIPSLGGGFLNWDDVSGIVQNPAYRGLDPAHLRWMFSNVLAGPYTPLAWVTLGCDYLAWGLDPRGYHLTSVLIHCANSVLLYFAAAALLERAAAPAVKEEIIPAAFFAALLFSLHPLRVESVSWLSGRHDPLATLFFLAAVLAYVRARGSAAAAPGRRLLPVLFFLLALLSKASAVVLPLVLLLLDVYPLRRLPADPRLWFKAGNRGVFLEKLPYFALSLAFGLIAVSGQAEAGKIVPAGALTAGERLRHILTGLFFYPFKTLLPLKLSPLYLLPGAGILALYAFALIAAAGLIYSACPGLRPAFAAASVYYLLTVWPLIGLFKVTMQPASDRYSYLTCLGFALFGGAVLLYTRRAAARLARAAIALAACLMIASLAAAAVRQQRYWHDSEALWTRAVSLAPHAEAYLNLGIVQAAEGRAGEAEENYRRALAVNGSFALAHYNLGILLAQRGSGAEALGHYAAALAIRPDLAEAHVNLGYLLAGAGRLPEAMAHYAEALRLKPGLALAHNDWGIALYQGGDTAGAVRHFREALRLAPDYADARNNLAAVSRAGK